MDEGSESLRLDQLAVFAGEAAFEDPVHVGRPNIGDRDVLSARIDSALDRAWITNGGPLVDEFERRVTEFLGVEHCVAVSSATVGLQLVARALELQGEVIVPSFTFVGTAHALAWIGLTPVFCDVDRRTHTLDPARVADAICDRTAAVLGVHMWGRPCAVEELAEVTSSSGVPLIFDAAHAFGCAHRGRRVGGFGVAEVFSFHATKVVNSAEGGAVTTNDAGLAAKLRLMRNFGFSGYDTVVELGTNAKMSELNAAMGLTSLDSMSEFVAANHRNYVEYSRGLDGISGVRLVEFDPHDEQNLQYVTVEVEPSIRDDLVRVLQAENVLARRYFYPGCHRSEPYRSRASAEHLPSTEELTACIINLPTGSAVTAEMVHKICELISLAIHHADEVRRRLGDPES